MVRLGGGNVYATQVAVPRQHVIRLEKALRAARLKPVTMSLGLPAMQPATAEQGTLALLAGGEFGRAANRLRRRSGGLAIPGGGGGERRGP